MDASVSGPHECTAVQESPALAVTLPLPPTPIRLWGWARAALTLLAVAAVAVLLGATLVPPLAHAARGEHQDEPCDVEVAP